MDLNSKYLYGFVFAACLSFGSILFLSNYFQEVPGLDFIFLGIVFTLLGIIFYVLLFSSERIKGYRAEYEASPDLKTFKVVKTYDNTQKIQKNNIPEIAYCSSCGKQIYRPFVCSKCNQLLCGEHYLKGSHNCAE